MSRLREIFTPGRRAAWKKFSQELGGQFVADNSILRRDKILLRYKNWNILIEITKRGKKTLTRIKALYVNRDSFQFRIYRRNLIADLGKKTGLQDIEIGFHQFDKDFIIQGNDTQKLKELFNDDLIRDLISFQPSIDLTTDVDQRWMTDPFREGLSELRFETWGIISNPNRLHDLYDLFSKILNQLCHIGSAYEDDPLSKFS